MGLCMIYLGMATGSTKYLKLTTGGGISFSSTSVYGKNYLVNDINCNADVGAVESYASVTNLNATTITLTFDYNIENVKLFFKTSESEGTTTELTGATITADKRKVNIKTSLNTSLLKVYLMVVVNGVFKPPTIKYNYTLNITNCTSNLTGGNIEEGEQTITLTRTGTENLFYQVPYLVMGGLKHNFIVSENLESATITLTINNDVEIFGITETKVLVIYKNATFNNCTCNYSDGEVYSLEKPIIISANSGYQFLGEFYFNYKKLGTTYERTFINEGVRLYYDEDLSNIQYIKLNDNYNATLKPVEPLEPVSQFTNIYLINKDELTLLSKERYQSVEGTKVDFGDYITNLYNTPFKIPSNIVGGKSDITLGNLKTSVTSSLLISSKFIIDMGTIKVTEKYNNVYDYSNVMYVLHLPYFDKIYLDSEYVVNQSIKIEYVFDVYTGSATVNIYSSFIDSIIESRTNIIVSQIPFLRKQTNSVIGNITTVNKNNIVSPFIEVVRNIPYHADSIFGGKTIEYGVIGDYEGFTRCENILLNSRATNTEKEEIIKLLNEGVLL